MTEWVRWSAPAAVVLTVAAPAYAVQYLSVAQAQKLAFPSATRFSEAEGGRAWKAEAGGKVLGLLVVDHVIGKHLYIDYAVALAPGGRVQRVEILAYRESYGGEIRSASWLGPVVRETRGRALGGSSDIPEIFAAT